MSLTAQQVAELLKPMDAKRVGRDQRGNSHVEAWDVRRYLLRIFGWGGWDFEIVEAALVHEGFRTHPDKGKADNGAVQYTVVYRVLGRLVIRDPQGNHVAHFEDGATGDAQNQPTIGDAHDMALKGLALDTPIATPYGWSTMGALVVGDVVFDIDGQPVRVRATSPVKSIPCYRVTFQNGRSVVCDAEHLWVARVAQEKPKTHAIADLWEAKHAGKPVVVPVAAPLVGAQLTPPLDPWVLGYWLGNGDRNGARVTCHTADALEVAAAVTSAGYEVGSIAPDKRSNAVCVNIRGLRKSMAEAGLLGSKHVPAQYLRASQGQRRALLAGLMDSDGSAGARGRAVFTSTDRALAAAVAELARSLGESVTCTEDWKSGYGKTVLSHNVEWTPAWFVPFALSRKASRARLRTKRQYGHRIASIEAIESVPTRCISVDSATETFLCGSDMVPTHNTAMSQALKRCAVNLGDGFGLSLYNDGTTQPVVIGTVGGWATPDKPEAVPDVAV